MKRTFVVLVSLGLLSFPQPSLGVSDSSVRLLLTGQFHGDEISAESGETWYGLFADGDGFKLVATRIEVAIVEDAIMDAEGEKTGKEVSLEFEGEPLFLVRGSEDFQAGPVKTAFRGAKFLYPGQSEVMTLAPSKYFRLSAFGEALDGLYEAELKDYTLKFVQGQGEKQTIVRYEQLYSLDGRPELLWAGDLDRDGKLDLFFNLTDHYNVMGYTLFLSSKSGEGEYLRKVAELILTGC